MVFVELESIVAYAVVCYVIVAALIGFNLAALSRNAKKKKCEFWRMEEKSTFLGRTCPPGQV